MNKLLLVGALLLGGTAHAQVPGTSVSSFTTKSGATYHKGDTLHLGMGKMDNGAFKYAYLPPNMFLGTPQKQLTSTWNNLNPVIKDIKQQKTARGMAPRTVAVIAAPGINACIDLESAEAAGELLPKVAGH